MLLQHKNAVIHGAGGAIGGAVARAFAREGAKVFLAGRTLAALDTVAEEIAAEGGAAETSRVDAFDKESIEQHTESVIGKVGRIDISFNAVGIEDVQGSPILEMSLDDFAHPISLAMRTQFLTATVVARQMIKQRSGVIQTVTATAARLAMPNTGGFGPACAAVECLYRQLAGELGPHGLRVICVRSAGSPDALGPDFEAAFVGTTLLRRLPLLAEVGNVAALMASDHASPMTGTVANVTCGAIVD